MKAWEKAMHDGEGDELDKLLSDNFAWENIAMDGSSSKAETIKFAVNIRKDVPSFKVGNFKTLHEGQDIIFGTHSVHQEDRVETIVLCVANLSDDRNQISMWRHLRAEYPK